jgi:hypothetical protein
VVTHFEATLTLLGIVIGMLGTLIGLGWKARGWIDSLNATDRSLAEAIDALRRTMQSQHADNQRRLAALENQERAQRGHPPRRR